MVILFTIFAALVILGLVVYSIKIEADAARERAKLYAAYQKAVDKLYGIK